MQQRKEKAILARWGRWKRSTRVAGTCNRHATKTVYYLVRLLWAFIGPTFARFCYWADSQVSKWERILYLREVVFLSKNLFNSLINQKQK